MSYAPHVFRPQTNPRYNSCAECRRTEDYYWHLPNPDIPRDVEDEQAIKHHADSLAPHLQSLNYAELFWMSEHRALDGPVRNADSRNNYQEIAEELSDALNYAVWEIQRLRRRGADESQQMKWLAVIVKLAETWDCLEEAKRPG